jgi:hypothetical protein
MSDRDYILLIVGAVAGYVIGRAHAQRLATAKEAAPVDPMAWLSAWQAG